MQNKKLDRVIKKLYFSTSVRTELRESPATVATRFGLKQTELEAVQGGDAHTLVAAGMDPRLVTDATPTLLDKTKLQTHRALAFGLVLVSMFVLAPFAYAGAQVAPRIGRRVGLRAGRRVSARRVLARVRARISARVGERHARHSLRALLRVQGRMFGRSENDKLKPNELGLQTDDTISLQDPIQ